MLLRARRLIVLGTSLIMTAPVLTSPILPVLTNPFLSIVATPILIGPILIGPFLMSPILILIRPILSASILASPPATSTPTAAIMPAPASIAIVIDRLGGFTHRLVPFFDVDDVVALFRPILGFRTLLRRLAGSRGNRRCRQRNGRLFLLALLTLIDRILRRFHLESFVLGLLRMLVATLVAIWRLIPAIVPPAPAAIISRRTPTVLLRAIILRAHSQHIQEHQPIP